LKSLKKKEVELSPIENATELIANKVQALRNEIRFGIDTKTLSILLHGALLTQVNAGPLAIAKTFLAEENRGNFLQEHVQTMDQVFLSFVHILADAVGKQKPLIETHEIPIQFALENGYFDFKEKICTYLKIPLESISETFSRPEGMVEFAPINTMATNSPDMKKKEVSKKNLKKVAITTTSKKDGRPSVSQGSNPTTTNILTMSTATTTSSSSSKMVKSGSSNSIPIPPSPSPHQTNSPVSGTLSTSSTSNAISTVSSAVSPRKDDKKNPLSTSVKQPDSSKS